MTSHWPVKYIKSFDTLPNVPYQYKKYYKPMIDSAKDKFQPAILNDIGKRLAKFD